MVRSGLVLSRKKATDDTGIYYPLLNLRSVHPEGYIDKAELDDYYASEPLSAEHVSHTGDIIIRLTAPYTAVLIDESTENMVISSNFVIVRVKDHQILPEYLFWLLNTKKVRYGIYENSTSNMLGAVKARYFTEFPIIMIPLEEQRQIAAMNRLAKREAVLLRQLAEEKEKYYTAIIEKFQREVRNHDK